MLDFLRLDPSMVAGLNANQTLMAVVALTSAGVLLWRHLRKEKPAPEESAE
jgi:phosphatidylglycerol:prolipoprotein diacylglycerol transferase